MTWILLRSGHPFDLASPTPDMIRPVDIAYALARICRFNGHTRDHYSVAQHSLHVAELVPPEHRLVALLHDAAEAYIGDLSSPLKAMLPAYRAIEARIWSVICQRFGIPEEMPECVKQADLIMLATERRDVMPHFLTEWDSLKGIEPRAEKIIPMDAQTARTEWLRRYGELTSGAPLAPTLNGMRIDASGVLGRIADGARVTNDLRWGCSQLNRHLEELGRRYYAGEIAVVDEFLQLYCIDATRPEAVTANTSTQAQEA